MPLLGDSPGTYDAASIRAAILNRAQSYSRGLFNLESALELYDAVQEQIATYERKLQEELGQQACEALKDEDCPRPRRRPSRRGESSRSAPRCTATRRRT